jgi:hypothetical protein
VYKRPDIEKQMVGKIKGRDHSVVLVVDGNVMLDWILRELGWESVDWIHLAQDSNQWRVLVNSILNLRVLYNIPGNFLTE